MLVGQRLRVETGRRHQCAPCELGEVKTTAGIDLRVNACLPWECTDKHEAALDRHSEVIDMAIHDPLHKVGDSVAYWAQWIALQLWGPATQDSSVDPIEELKRRHGRSGTSPRNWP